MFKKIVILFVLLILGSQSAFAGRSVGIKEVDGSPNYWDIGGILVPNGSLDLDKGSAEATLNLLPSVGTAIFNGSSFTTNGTNLTKANAPTLGNGTTLSKTVYGDSANQVIKLTLTRFLLAPLKAAGGAQANGALLLTLPAGAQILPGADFTALKVFASNGAAAIKSNGAVLALGSVKASGAVRTLGGTATFQNILTGQQNQFNGRTLNAVASTPYATAVGGVKSIYANYANGFPAVSSGTLYVNGTVFIPVINLL